MSSIGILDSGVGGLSVLKEIHAILPQTALHYIADSAWCPYGPRPTHEIQKRVACLTDHLIAQGAEVIIIACNSATITAIESLRSHYPQHFIGMEPAVKPAAALTQTGTIGIMATEASIAGEKFHHLVSAHADTLKVITRPCPEFVTLVEKGEIDESSAQSTIRDHTKALVDSGADVLVLGCSHYPFLKHLIEKEAGDSVTVIDTGSPIAKRLKGVLVDEEIIPRQGPVTIETTGSLELLERLTPLLIPEILSPKLKTLSL